MKNRNSDTSSPSAKKEKGTLRAYVLVSRFADEYLAWCGTTSAVFHKCDVEGLFVYRRLGQLPQAPVLRKRIIAVAENYARRMNESAQSTRDASALQENALARKLLRENPPPVVSEDEYARRNAQLVRLLSVPSGGKERVAGSNEFVEHLAVSPERLARARALANRIVAKEGTQKEKGGLG